MYDCNRTSTSSRKDLSRKIGRRPCKSTIYLHPSRGSLRAVLVPVEEIAAVKPTEHAGMQTKPLPIDCACSASESPIVACLVRRYCSERGQRVSKLRRRQLAR